MGYKHFTWCLLFSGVTFPKPGQTVTVHYTGKFLLLGCSSNFKLCVIMTVFQVFFNSMVSSGFKFIIYFYAGYIQPTLISNMFIFSLRNATPGRFKV